MIDPVLIERLRILCIQALVTNDKIMDRLRLKGGNALELVYRIAERSSMDIDFSMEDNFDDQEFDAINVTIEENIEIHFMNSGFISYDFSMKHKPSSGNMELANFWGGYLIEFKVIEKSKFDDLKGNLEAVRRNSIPIGKSSSTLFRVEISCFEFCPNPELKEVDGYAVHVYSLALIAIEKLRTICQQLEEYKEIVPSMKRSPRARDFFDIYLICEKSHINLLNSDNINLIQGVFGAKRVPITYLKKIEIDRNFHKIDYPKLTGTIKPSIDIKDFDFYFDYVKNLAEKATSLLENKVST